MSKKPKEKPPTLEEIEAIEPEISDAERKLHGDVRVVEAMEFLEEAQDNPVFEEYLEIDGVSDDELFSPNCTRITRELIMLVLLLIERTGTMTKACSLLGMSNSSITEQSRRYPALKKAFILATNRHSANLIDKATDLAMNGWKEEVYGKGPGKDGGTILVGMKTKRDPRILETLLAANVKKYRKQQVADLGNNQVIVNLNFGDGSKEVMDGSGNIIIDTSQLDTKALPAAGVESHDPGFEEIEGSEL